MPALHPAFTDPDTHVDALQLIPQLPDPPRFDLLPVAVRSAAKLYGALVSCGPGVRGIGWPETPRVRATALAEHLLPERVATQLTAAWVWGASESPGYPLRFSTTQRRRVLLPVTECVIVTESLFESDDITTLSGFNVTTPTRTMIDLLHNPHSFSRTEVVACRLLGLTFPTVWNEVAARLRRRRRPHCTRARARFRLLGFDAAIAANQASE